MRKPLSKKFLLAMSEWHWVNGAPELSWDYLIAWGFYDMYVEGWWQE